MSDWEFDGETLTIFHEDDDETECYSLADIGYESAPTTAAAPAPEPTAAAAEPPTEPAAKQVCDQCGGSLDDGEPIFIMSKFPLRDGKITGAPVAEETILSECRDKYDDDWYDDEEMDQIESQVEDGERDFEDCEMNGVLSDSNAMRFNRLYDYYSSTA